MDKDGCKYPILLESAHKIALGLSYSLKITTTTKISGFPSHTLGQIELTNPLITTERFLLEYCGLSQGMIAD